MLTTAELEFLSSQGLSAIDVFDTKGRSPKSVKEDAKALGKAILLGAPCQAAGHRLRTRSGHCAQCDSSKIAYQRRTEVQSDVYVAISNSLGWVKVGSSTNISARQYKLNFDAYGGATDWKLIFFVRAERGGRLELAAHSALSQFCIEAEYTKDGQLQVSRECFSCSEHVAVQTIMDCAKSGNHRIAFICKDREYWRE